MRIEKIKEIVEKYPTPGYIFDLDMLKARILNMQKYLGDEIELCYAMKANPFLVEPLKGQIGKFEVCSPGEFRICERAGIPMSDIVMSGVYKERKEVARAVDMCEGSGTFTIESFQHLQKISECAEAKGKKVRALIRLSSGNQFGVDKDTLRGIVERREQYPFLHFVGVQYYSGTQKKKFEQFQKEIHTLDELFAELKREYDFDVEEMEYGPGFYYPYFVSDPPADDEKLLTEFAEALSAMKFKGKITLEIGRYIASECGYYATSIVDQKETDGARYCIVDGGINHVNYYGQTMAMRTPHIEHIAQDAGEEQKWNICGSLCTVGDVLVKQLPLKAAREGDVLVFKHIGAYSVTEGIYLFLSRDMPKILFYSEEKGVELVRDVISTDMWNFRQ